MNALSIGIEKNTNLRLRDGKELLRGLRLKILHSADFSSELDDRGHRLKFRYSHLIETLATACRFRLVILFWFYREFNGVCKIP